MRSVGRATPNGLWAGAAIETPNARDEPTAHIRVDSAPGHIVCYPKLFPFVRALQGMAHRNPWWKEIPLRLHPALWQDENFREKMLGALSPADHSLLSHLLSLFSDASTRLPHEIRDYLIVQNAGWSASEAEKAVYQMLNIGVLWSTLELPGSYSDPWCALRAILPKIPDSERNCWAVAVRALGKICSKLNIHFHSMPLEDLPRYMSAARACVNRLLTRYGIAVLREDANVLVADMQSPFRVSISSSIRKRIENSLRAYWAFDWYGMGELQAVIDRKREFSALRSDEDLSLGEFLRRQETLKNSVGCGAFTHQIERFQPLNGEFGPRAERGLIVSPWEHVVHSIDDVIVKARANSIFACWNQELDSVFNVHRYRLQWRKAENTTSQLPPGSALIRLEIKGLDCSVRIGSVTPDPCFFYSRFAPLFAQSGRRVDPFPRWYQKSLRSVEALFPELHFVDISIRSVVNLNAASRPRFSKHILDGFYQNDDLLGSVRIKLGTNGLPNLRIPGLYSAILPLRHSAVSISASDAYSRCLLGVSFLLGRSSLMWPLPRFSAEINRWHHLPRLSIDETTIVTAERWTPPRSIVEELSRRSGLECYIAWRRFSRSAHLPKLVYAKYGVRQTETLMAVDSVLAVENLNRTLGAYSGTFLLQEVVPPPSESWIRDSDGKHYVAELAVAWQGEAAFWMNYIGKSVRAQVPAVTAM
jgi:hypothetical protein